MVLSRNQFIKLWSLIALSMFAIQYARPQDYVPQLEMIRPFALSSICVLLFLLISREKWLQFRFLQIRLIWWFLGWTILFVPFAQSRTTAIQTLSDLFMMMPLVFAIPLLVDNVRKLKLVINISIIIAVIISVAGIIKHDGLYKGAMFNLGSFLGDPNDLSLYTNMMLPVCFFMMLYESKKSLKILYAATTALMVGMTIISFSRGGLLGMVCAGVVMWAYSPNRKTTAVIGIIGLLLTIGIVGPQWKEEVAGTAINVQESTAQTRLITWKGSLRTFIHYPMGIGIGNVPATIYRFIPPHENPMRWWGDMNHSFWLTALAEGGIIGFAIIMAIIFYNFRDAVLMRRLTPFSEDARFMKYMGAAFVGALVAFCASGTFITVNYYPHFWYLTAIIAAASRITFTLTRGASHV